MKAAYARWRKRRGTTARQNLFRHLAQAPPPEYIHSAARHAPCDGAARRPPLSLVAGIAKRCERLYPRMFTGNRCAWSCSSAALRPRVQSVVCRAAGPLPRPRTSRAAILPASRAMLRALARGCSAALRPARHPGCGCAYASRHTTPFASATPRRARRAALSAYGSAGAPCPSTPSRLRRGAPGPQSPPSAPLRGENHPTPLRGSPAAKQRQRRCRRSQRHCRSRIQERSPGRILR